jgi:hypothetical protein
MRHNGRLKTWNWPHALAIPALALVYAAVAWRWGTVGVAQYVYLGTSAITFIVYAIDKTAAKAWQ